MLIDNNLVILLTLQVLVVCLYLPVILITHLNNHFMFLSCGGLRGS